MAKKNLLLIIFCFFSCKAFALQGEISHLRILDRSEKEGKFTRIVMWSNLRPIYDIEKGNKYFSIKFNNQKLATNINKTIASNLITNIEFTRDKIELNLANNFSVKRQFILDNQPYDGNFMLVFDLQEVDNNQIKEGKNTDLVKQIEQALGEEKQIAQTPIAILPILKPRKKPIIIIDAGHGGTDPGSQGLNGTFEKDLTLSYAFAINKVLKDSKKYKPIMTRNKDIFIALKDRVEFAKKKKGDIFISLHADNHQDKTMQGLSIYTLSDSASDKEAEILAQKENKADLFSTIKLPILDKEATDILIDLATRNNKNNSADFAELLINHFSGNNVKLLRNTHRFAGFRVLTSPEIPSVLIELGYISNDEEEKLLNSKKHKELTAKLLLQVMDQYFEDFY